MNKRNTTAVVAFLAISLIQGSAFAKVPKEYKKDFKNYKAAINICARFATDKNLRGATRKLDTYNKKSRSALLKYPEGVKEIINVGIATRDNKRPSKEEMLILQALAQCESIMPEHIDYLKKQEASKAAIKYFKPVLKSCSRFGRIKKVNKAESEFKAFKQKAEEGTSKYSKTLDAQMKSSVYVAKDLNYIRGNKTISEWIDLCDSSMVEHMAYLQEKDKENQMRGLINQMQNYILSFRSSCEIINHASPTSLTISRQLADYGKAREQLVNHSLFEALKGQVYSNESSQSLNELVTECDAMQKIKSKPS